MNKLPLRTHVLIAILIWLLLSLLFTFLPYRLPAPEPFSPWVYLLAAIVTLVALLRQPRFSRQFWLCVPILLLALFGYLEESSYGVESGAVQPLYSETYNVELYDVHNFIPILETTIVRSLENQGWNFTMAGDFLRADLLFLGGLALFSLGIPFAIRHLDPQGALKRIMGGVASATALVSFLAIGWLLSLPADAGGSFAFGYSATRLAIVIVILLVGVLPALMWVSWDRVASRLMVVWKSDPMRRLVPILLTVILVSGFAYQVWASTVIFTGQIAILERLNPFVVWLTMVITFVLLGFRALQGYLHWFYNFTKAVAAFFRVNPAYVYVLACIFIVGSAQLMDQDRISLAQYMSFANPWGEEWNYWLEELFEMTGAFQMLAAASAIALQKKD